MTYTHELAPGPSAEPRLSITSPVAGTRPAPLGSCVRFSLPGRLRHLSTVPFAVTLILLLLVTTIWTRTHASESDALFDWVSTNVHNLSVAPIRSFVLSALFLTSGHWLQNAAMLAAVLIPLERRIGTLRILAVFASAHVLATVLTEGWIWYALRVGIAPAAERYQQDVGISYGLYGAAAAVLFFVPLRFRPWAVAALAAYLGAQFALDPGMTSTGHLLSLAIGLAWWPVLARWQRHSVPAFAR